jgi:hypothetical protein
MKPAPLAQPAGRGVELALGLLENVGFLMLADAHLPSVASLVAGGPVRGSWWGHPSGHAIFATSEALADHPDVATAKVVSGKVTYVHRRLWPALLAVATAREPWQLRGLSPSARALLARVDRHGTVRTDETPGRSLGDAARELEARLLVHGESIHTERGAHAKVVESWKAWAKRARAPSKALPAARAKRQWEEALAAASPGGPRRLPWP